MVLELEQIKQLILSDCPDWVKKARKYSKKLNVHINGEGTADYLAHIEGHENQAQYALRQKVATSNKFLFKNLLRPVDKVFQANGGSRIVKTKTTDSEKVVLQSITNITDNYPVRKFIDKIQANKYYSDPSGVVFFEWEDGNTYPTFKSIGSIKNYESDGRQLEWILFEGEEREIDGKKIQGKYYRFVDDSGDYTYKELNGQITLIEDEVYDNPWGYVPAFTNSDLIDHTLTYHISPIDEVVELADHYLRTTSIKNIYEFLHGYPIFWAYVEKCRVCDGTGLYEGATCTTCGGDGHTFKKDVSDVLKLKPPTSNDDPKLAPDVAGYVQPDLETWKEQRIELNWLLDLMSITMWGSKMEQAENETATAAFLDVQPVNDRLNQFADAFEQTERLIIDIVGRFYALDNYEGVSVNYGRRFLVESPDKVWEKYQTARIKGSPKSTLDYLLMQFYQSEFKNDLESLVKAEKAIVLEPFIHNTTSEVVGWNISEEDKKKKLYFNEWWISLEDQHIITKNIPALQNEFNEYLKTKETVKKEQDGQEVQ